MSAHDQDSDELRDEAQCAAFEITSAAFARLMSVCADLDPYEVARDLAERFVQDRAHLGFVPSSKLEHDELMRFVESRSTI